EAGQPVAFALFFHNFSTFLGRRGLYLEDLFVRPAFRRRGYGRALLIHLARLAKHRRCGRFEWAVLDWNQSAIDFYRSLGGTLLPPQQTSDRGLMLAVHADGGYGYAATSDLSPAGLQAALDRAGELARASARHALIDTARIAMPAPRGEHLSPEALPLPSRREL